MCGADIKTKFLQNLLRPLIGGVFFQKNTLCVFIMKEDILRYIQVRLRIQFLVNHRDPPFNRFRRSVYLIRLSFKCNDSGIKFVQPYNGFH